MSRLMIAGAFALAATLPMTPLAAQSGYSADKSSITVIAPRMRHEGRTSSGAPIRVVETDSRVYTGDLNLRTSAGRRELDMRVEAAAAGACDFLDQNYPTSYPLDTPRECRNDAVTMAQAQVREAVERAALYGY